MEITDRYTGCLIGLAVGDAVGTALEFKAPGTFSPVSGMQGGGPFHLKPGEWTDDTSMALCLAASLVEKNGADPVNQLERYLRWYRKGYMSSTGKCFDIGITTREALSRFEKTYEAYPGSTDHFSAGNGSIMRLSPVPLFYAGNPLDAIERSGESSRTTHGARTAVDACRYMGGILAGIVRGESKETALSDHYSPVPGYWNDNPLIDEVDEVAGGSFKLKEPPEIKGTGYVVKSLEAALWAFHKSENFRHGCLLAVNLGDDADTTGAVYGQIAGAYYGIDGIPDHWKDKLAKKEMIEKLAIELYKLSR